MHKRIIKFLHNAKNIFNALMNIIQELHCGNKIHSFTFDNVTFNITVINKLAQGS